MSKTLTSRIIAFSSLILVGWALAALYGFLAQLAQPGWFTIAVVHSALALAIWRFGQDLRPPVRGSWPLAFAPAIAVVAVCVLAASASRFWIAGAEPGHNAWDPSQLAFILWIPLVEETVFRLGLGGILRRHLGNFLGAYGSALLFAMAHSSSTWGHLTMPLGPLLLALLCEGLYVRFGRLSAIIAMHAACNASGLIFSQLDPRWLEWLQALYLKV